MIFVKSKTLAGLLLFTLCLVPTAQAAYTLTVTQSGANVVANDSGSINTTGLSNSGTASWFAEIWPSFPQIAVGPTSSVAVTFWTGISGPANIGSGPQVLADTGSGTLVALLTNSGFELQSGYVSGSAITGTATWNNRTLAGLGLTPGTYTYTWGSGGNADTFTLVIGTPVSNTPVPSSWYLMTLGILCLGLWQAYRTHRRA